jgi:hypothetical protein
MYRTLGCFHSLQPTASAFEAPSVPCLLPAGFVRWQTIQLLLHPDEHALCIQKAVAMYDIPKPGGGSFPKTIPRESFPLQPDEAMEKWHNVVLDKLDEGSTNRLKNSPYASPYEAADREGYFPHNGPHMRRTSRPPRTENRDPPHGLSDPARRRSSVPNVPSPNRAPEHSENHHWTSDQTYNAPNPAVPQSPRHRPSSSTASQRPSSQPHHHASSSHPTTTANVASTSNSAKSFHFNFENFHIPFISSPFNSKKSRDRSSTSAARNRPKPRPSSRYEAVSTGSEASSEDSLPRPSKYERDQRRSSLAPPNDYNRYQRRHSHDASYSPSSSKYKPAIPPPIPRLPTDYGHAYNPYVPTIAPIPGLFRNNLYPDGHGTSSAPESPSPIPVHPKVRVVSPPGRDPSGERGRDRRGGASLLERRAVSADRRSRSDDRRGGESMDRTGRVDRERLNLRREGVPLRVNTVAGASSSSRRVRNPEVRSAGVPSARRAPAMGLSGGGRR